MKIGGGEKIYAEQLQNQDLILQTYKVSLIEKFHLSNKVIVIISYICRYNIYFLDS